jgi:hypothetical protein
MQVRGEERSAPLLKTHAAYGSYMKEQQQLTACDLYRYQESRLQQLSHALNQQVRSYTC